MIRPSDGVLDPAARRKENMGHRYGRPPSTAAALTDTAVAEFGALAAPGRVRRLSPYAGVLLLLAVAMLIDGRGNRGALVTAAILCVALVVGVAVAPWRRMSRHWQSAAMLAPIAVLAVASWADAAAGSRFAFASIVPLLFIALYGDRRLMTMATVLALGSLAGECITDPTLDFTMRSLVYAAILLGLLPAFRRLVADHRRALESLADLADRDPLTGLANRRALERRTRELPASDRGLGLIFVDIDHFKTVNDTYGHDIGDALLVLIGQRLVHSTRSADIVSRVGGDEFVIGSNGDLAATAALAERIEAEIKGTPFHVGADSVTVRVSVGFSHTESDDVDTSALLTAADRSMYAAKATR
jgi:diguanylate cyclase (GGDEF)-like protein